MVPGALLRARRGLAEGTVEVLQRGEAVPVDAERRGPIRVRYSGGGPGPA
ncbi:DUF3253 domain-containing protein [Acidimicrobiia bacterium EGI L10123]|nr:DUF3253 domain-containing protein [Acidimicrobiia bacterium EGI L10123]